MKTQVITYEPLIVTPKEDKKDPAKVVTFINGALTVFQRGTQQPKAGVPVEIMITGLLYDKEENGFHSYTKPVKLVFAQVVDHDKHVIVNHDGFECSGSMCATRAGVHGEKNPGLFPGYHSEMRGGRWMPGDGRYNWITPGRVGVREVSNVNAGSTWKVDRMKVMPGQVWLLREFIEGLSTTRRVEGVSALSELMHGELICARSATPGPSLWNLEVAEKFSND